MPNTKADEDYLDLDPEDWTRVRRLGHKMLDDIFDSLSEIQDRAVWQCMPDSLRTELHTALPQDARDLELIYEDFRRLVLPYTPAAHPRFVGWVHGGGTVAGILAELLSAGLNANVGGRNHSPVEIERAVIRWSAQLLGYPEEASGVLLTGTSMANFVAVIVARTKVLGANVRDSGISARTLVAYTSASAHVCIARALDFAGLGREHLRLIACDENGRMNVHELERRIEEDLAQGVIPFLVVGTAGSVDLGAIDDLVALSDICRRFKLWFHVDAAFGAMGMLSSKVRLLLEGISKSDSVAFDFHKWGQVQYDAGCIIVKDPVAHANAFASHASYLSREQRGLAAGHPWPCDFGPDLSRSFRALKVWMTLQAYGAKRLGLVVDHCCDLAKVMEGRIKDESELELLAPVSLNVVCFRYVGSLDCDSSKQLLDDLNREITADLQESGLAAPSTSVVNGCLAIRAAFVNHRTRMQDVHILLDGVLNFGRIRVKSYRLT